VQNIPSEKTAQWAEAFAEQVGTQPRIEAKRATAQAGHHLGWTQKETIEASGVHVGRRVWEKTRECHTAANAANASQTALPTSAGGRPKGKCRNAPRLRELVRKFLQEHSKETSRYCRSKARHAEVLIAREREFQRTIHDALRLSAGRYPDDTPDTEFLVNWHLWLQVDGPLLPLRTLTSSPFELYREFQKSVFCEQAAAEGFRLKQAGWFYHLREEQYNFKKPQRLVDVCDTCLYFVRVVCDEVAHVAQYARETVSQHDVNYFADFDKKWGAPTQATIASVSYLKAFAAHLDNRMARDTKLQTQRSVKERLDLHAAEAKASHSIRSAMQTCEIFEHHWHSVRRQHTECETVLATLRPNQLFLQYRIYDMV